MSERHVTAEQLRQDALAQVREGDIEQALSTYDRAIQFAADEETRELITINKADAMIAISRYGIEVQSLPQIVMRRRNLRHVYLAAYALAFKYRNENELNRAIFYGELALSSAMEAGETLWKALALNELASVHDINSNFVRAIECGEEALALVAQLNIDGSHNLAYGLTLENLGASKVLNEQFAEGIALINQALPLMPSRSHRAEAYIDLCFGYLGLDDLDRARDCGEAGLECATEPRQIRNAHYLLGEVAYKAHDLETAEMHFDELAKFYPDFRHLKPLLYAIDLRSMVNLKL